MSRRNLPSGTKNLPCPGIAGQNSAKKARTAAPAPFFSLKKPRRVCRPQAANKFNPFFAAACTSQKTLLIPKPVKKLEKLFIAPKVRQVLYETSQRVFTRCACARRTGFLIKFLIKNQYEKNFRPGTRPGRKWIAFDLPPAGGKLCEAF